MFLLVFILLFILTFDLLISQLFHPFFAYVLSSHALAPSLPCFAINNNIITTTTTKKKFTGISVSRQQHSGALFWSVSFSGVMCSFQVMILSDLAVKSSQQGIGLLDAVWLRCAACISRSRRWQRKTPLLWAWPTCWRRLTPRWRRTPMDRRSTPTSWMSHRRYRKLTIYGLIHGNRPYYPVFSWKFTVSASFSSPSHWYMLS